jgi:hypothetical protein
MEQRGRNRPQTLRREKAKIALIQRETVAAGCHQLPFGSPEKEGSSLGRSDGWSGERVGRASHCTIMRCLLYTRARVRA